MRKTLVFAASSLASLCVAASAFAGPAPLRNVEASPLKAQDQGATSQPAQPAATDSPSAPATAPAVTVNVGDGTVATANPPKKDAPAEEPKAETKKKPRPFQGSNMMLMTTASTGTFLKSQQLTYNPTVTGALWLLPRFAISEAFQLRARLIVETELTNSDSTTYRREPELSDLGTQLFYRKIPAFAGIKPMVSANFGLPLSKVSQARTMIVNPGLTLQLARPVEHVLGGEMLFLVSGVYSHPLYRQTTPVAQEQQQYSPACIGGTCQDSGFRQVTGAANPSDILSWMVLATGEWGKWSPAVLFWGTHQFAYTFRDYDGVGRIEDRTSTRQSIYFSTWLDYHLNSYLTPEIGYYMSRNVLNGNGRYGNPFFDPDQDARVYLGLNVNLDALAQKIEGGDGEAGVVRAKNTHTPRRPMFAF